MIAVRYGAVGLRRFEVVADADGAIQLPGGVRSKFYDRHNLRKDLDRRFGDKITQSQWDSYSSFWVMPRKHAQSRPHIRRQPAIGNFPARDIDVPEVIGVYLETGIIAEMPGKAAI